MTSIEQIVVTTSPADAELASSALFDLGAVAVEERAEADPSGPVRLVAGFAEGVDLTPIAVQLARFGHVERVQVADDGLDRWRTFATVTTVGPLKIVPAWLVTSTSFGALEVVIEPGQAFGIGDHPTTRLALGALVDRVEPDVSVLDVGTGSGVLAIAAARLGAQPVLAIDSEPHAVETARANVDLNDVAVEVGGTSLADVDEEFDIVVANLGGLDAPVGLASELISRTRRTLVVSGLLVGQVEAALTCFGPESTVRQLDGWAALVVDC